MKKFIIVVLVVLFTFSMVDVFAFDLDQVSQLGFVKIEKKVECPFCDCECSCYYQKEHYLGKNNNVVFFCAKKDGTMLYMRKVFSAQDPPVCLVPEFKKNSIWLWASLGCGNEVTVLKKIWVYKGEKEVVDMNISPFQFSEKGITDEKLAQKNLSLKIYNKIFNKIKRKIKYHW